MLAQPPLLHKAAGAVGTDGPLVAGVDAQVDAPQIELGEAILDQQPDRLAAIAPPPVRLVADGDAQFGRLGKRIAVVQAAKADEFTVGLNGEVDALGVAVAPALGRAPVEVGEGAG